MGRNPIGWPRPDLETGKRKAHQRFEVRQEENLPNVPPVFQLFRHGDFEVNLQQARELRLLNSDELDAPRIRHVQVIPGLASQKFSNPFPNS